MDQIILGTAGHIDHGKTSLIRALTGIETDRLKEEKKRGITIELGFASIPLSTGEVVGIVDVPGHEKFVKNMVAGASGIDIVAMAIAADEGVMPQTREHMEICTLMGIRHGFIALTKTDLVDEELLELAMEDVQEFTRDTFLEEAPIVPVSSTTGEGLDDFRSTLEALCRTLPTRQPSSIFRLPVDRVFTMKGFGTVITGTLASGGIGVGDEIMIFPSRITSKVRGIQVHGSGQEHVTAGVRTAINFQGLDRSAVERGDVLSTPDTLRPSHMVDARLTFLAGNAKPAKARTRVRFHSGTSEVFGYAVLLDRPELFPGDTAPVQIRLESPVSLMKGDRFVIRSDSPVKTIGGGVILNPAPRKHRLSDIEAIAGLKGLEEAEPDGVITYLARQARQEGITFDDLRVMTAVTDKKLAAELQKLMASRELVQTDKEQRRFVHGSMVTALSEEIVTRLSTYHRDNPLKEGMPVQELKSKLGTWQDRESRLLTQVIQRLTKEEQVVQEKGFIRLSGHAVALQVDQEALREDILKAYVRGGLTPPFFRTLCRDLEVDPKIARDVLQILIDENRIIKTKDDLYFNADAVSALEKDLVAYINKKGEITTPQFKEMTGISRKFVIPLIEYFDAVNLTIRVGDTRQLRKKG